MPGNGVGMRSSSLLSQAHQHCVRLYHEVSIGVRSRRYCGTIACVLPPGYNYCLFGFLLSAEAWFVAQSGRNLIRHSVVEAVQTRLLSPPWTTASRMMARPFM